MGHRLKKMVLLNVFKYMNRYYYIYFATNTLQVEESPSFWSKGAGFLFGGVEKEYRGQMAGKIEEKVHVRKRKDSVWRARELVTVPNWGIVSLLADGKVLTAREIYRALGKQFTRKTLIRSLHTLSFELKVLEPQHMKTAKKYDVGYSLSRPVLDAIEPLKRLSAALEVKEAQKANEA